MVADAKSKRTKVADPVLTYVVSNLATGDAATVLHGNLHRVAGETAGTYAILGDNLTTNANYTIAYTSALLTIIANQLPLLLVDTLVIDTSMRYSDLAGIVSTTDPDGDLVGTNLDNGFGHFNLSNDSLYMQGIASLGDTTFNLSVLLNDGRDTVSRALVVVCKLGSNVPVYVHANTSIAMELHKDQPLEAISLDGRRMKFANYAAALAALPQGVYVIHQARVAIMARIN